jgi:hypothetical protein
MTDHLIKIKQLLWKADQQDTTYKMKKYCITLAARLQKEYNDLQKDKK